MAARANLPKIITDVQDIVTQLSDEFKLSNEPITDDNHALHRLCAKLEFLFSTCTKEKSMLGNKKTYWHWIYACLKSTKGLGDGLKFVQANKELRTSKGRGRAFIRYCLVHQTLADSLQNCVMNQSITRQYFTSNSLLVNPTYSSSFVTSLYELNAVNFDLNAKGYDLDAGWPTFASKIRNSIPSDGMDQWAIRSHVGSLGSFPSASVVMDTPRMHGSGSSGPHSVDQRVEELVLELDQSDQRMKEQQEVIQDLETKAENIAKSTGEKEEILARVISDLESKNRHLHVAMSNMTSEFEAREEQWSEKHDQIVKDLTSCETKNQELQSKIKQLEQDKRTLEDTVSQRMSSITSAFVPAAEGETLAPKSPTTREQPLQTEASRKELEKLRAQVRELSEELEKSRERCVELQLRLDEAASDSTTVDDMLLKVEEKQSKIDFLEQKLASVSTEYQLFINNVKEVLSLSDDVTETSDLILEITKLRDRCKNRTESLLQQANDSDNSEQASSLKEENELLKFDRDIAHLDADSIKQKLRMAQLEIKSLKVEQESGRSKATSRIQELEENLSIQQHQMANQQRHHKEMLADLKLTQDALQQSEKELEETKKRCQEHEQAERDLRQEYDSLKRTREDEISDNEYTIEELQAEVAHHSSLCETLDRQLESEKVKCSRSNSELLVAKQVAESFSKQLNETKYSISVTEKSHCDLRSEVSRLSTLESVHEKQINFLSGIVEHFLAKIRQINETKDLSSLDLEEKPEENSSLPEECDLKAWENLSGTFHNIAVEQKQTKHQLQLLQTQYNEMKEETTAFKAKVERDMDDMQEQLSESQATNDIHLVTIEDLSDKHKVLQDSKAENLDSIDRLQVKIDDLNVSLNETKSVEDDLRLRVMEESAKRLDVEDKLKIRDEDIENLKDKVTQLLLDKDHLWKEGELLKDQLEDQVEALEEASWVEDDDVTSCSSCGVPFSVTVRKHHCRNCGKIFCNNCCSNWKLKDAKKVRFCDQCFNVTDLDMSSISPSKYSYSSPNTSSMSITKDSEQLSDTCSVLDDDDGLEDDSVISNRNESQSSMNGEATILVAARREFHLPVQVEHPGVTLHWEISTDRDIGFKLCYAPSEEEAMLELIPSNRINSHVEPFIGDLVARQEGIYTLIFDNTYSRFTSKSVTYKLGILASESHSPS